MMLDGRIERPARRAVPRASQRDARHSRHAAVARCRRRQGFDYRANGQSRLGPFTSNGQILLPKGGRATIAIAALDVGGTTRERRPARPIRAASPARSTLPAAGSTGRSASLRSAMPRRSKRICAASNVALPRRFAVRAGRVDGTIILADGPDDARRRGRRARASRRAAITLARLTANAKLVNGRARSARRWPARRGAAFEFSHAGQCHARPHRAHRARTVERRPLVLDRPAVLTRSGDGWQLAPTSVSLRRRARHLVGPERRAARSPCRSCRRCRCKCSTSSGPSLGFGGIATGRLDYALEGQSQRPRRPQDPRAEPRRPGAGVEADRRRARRGRRRRPGRAARGRGQRRQDHRPGAGALRADRPRADWSPS